MKTLLFGIALVFANLAQAAPATLFTGPYAVANFTAVPGSGSIDVSGAPETVTLTSGASNSGEDVVTDFYTRVVADAFFSFDWRFVSDDDPFFQAFGYLLGDSPGSLFFGGLTNADDAVQAGSASVFAQAGQFFGFRAISFQEGTLSATTTISNFDVLAVPEPATGALAGLALVAAAAAGRRSRVRRAT